jgi:hypothetical protein
MRGEQIDRAGLRDPLTVMLIPAQTEKQDAR